MPSGVRVQIPLTAPYILKPFEARGC
ncbi:MAG: hypothetical protein JWM44_1995, partial [Bacilli bacterium]|nr:hypothetical protein [Bacilli bacterium]